MNISTKLKFGNILYGCLRQVGCIIKVTANSGLTVYNVVICILQAGSMAHMQLEIEKQTQKKSPIAEMVRHMYYYCLLVYMVIHLYGLVFERSDIV